MNLLCGPVSLTVTHRLFHGLHSRFQLNQTSGEIKTAIALDRETTDSHQFSVGATNLYKPLTTLVEVRVVVEDINDNPPVFAKEEYVLSLSLYTKPGLLLSLNVSRIYYDA